MGKVLVALEEHIVRQEHKAVEVVVQVVQTELQLLVHQTEVYMVVVEVIQ